MMRQVGKAFDGKPYARNPRMRLDEAVVILRRAALTFGLLAGGSFACCEVSARTIAWYRFEEATTGVTTQETVFTNTVDAAKYPAYPAVCAFEKNGQFAKEGLSHDAAHMPVCTNAFPSALALVDPNDTCREYANNGAVAINVHKVNDNLNPVGAVLIDDHEDLRLQNGTIEFFARLPDTTKGFRCLFSRCGRAYKDAQTAFNLKGDLLGNGSMFLSLKVATIDGEPLFDPAGSVINGSMKEVTTTRLENMDNDRWRHVAIVIDGNASPKTVSLYLDYEKLGAVEYSGDILYEAGYPFAFGAHPQCYYYGAAELIDEVRFSDEALAPEQMLGYKAKSPIDDVGPSTLFHFPFEGANETVTLGAADMQNAISFCPFLQNAAVNSAYSRVNAAFRAPPKAASPYDPQADREEVPAAVTRASLRSRALNENLSSLHAVTNGTGEGFLRAVVLPDSITAADLFGESCTVECFARLPSRGFLTGTDQTHLLCLWRGFQVLVIGNEASWNYGYVQFAVGKTNLKSSDGQTAWVKHLADDRWHHLALVYDKENSRADAYIDYSWVAGAESPSLEFETHASYYNGFMIGGTYWNAHRTGSMWIDDVRVSRGALRPHRFLTTKALEGDLLARASFDNDLVMTPYTNFFGAAGEALAFVAGAKAPSFSSARLARTFTEGPEGKVLVERNRRSLAFDGGMVRYRDRGLLADSDAFTVEFLMRCPSSAAGAGIARVNRGSSEAVTADVTWALSFADAAGRLALKVDTDAAAGQAHAFDGASFADGVWHHVGIQFAPAGADTAVRLYRDAELVGSWNATGRLRTAPRLMNFMLGAGEDPTAGFVGHIDELRVSPGLVDPGKFMTPVRRGHVLVIR